MISSPPQATVLSSHRSFLRRLDVLDIGNPSKGTKGDPLAIFFFSDSMEVSTLLAFTHYQLDTIWGPRWLHLNKINQPIRGSSSLD